MFITTLHRRALASAARGVPGALLLAGSALHLFVARPAGAQPPPRAGGPPPEVLARMRAAQQQPDSALQAQAVRVFLDCSGGISSRVCDRDFFVVQLPFINLVRDRFDAEVHALITSLRAGNGGNEFTVTFLGQKRYAGRADTLVVNSLPNDADDVQRRALLQTLKLGLMPFVGRTPLARLVNIAYAGTLTGTVATPRNTRDRWNFWLYRVSANGTANLESLQSRLNLFGDINANRVTADWKIELGLNGSDAEDRFELRDGTTFVNNVRSFGGRFLVVKSLGEHWSAGWKGDANYSDFLNEDLAIITGPAVEYSLLPYAQATRRQVTALYSLAYAHFDFQETTIFGKDMENRPQHRLQMSWAQREPWGSVNLQLSGAQFLDKPSQYSAGLSGGVDLRIGRGLSIRVDGTAQRIRDQNYLPGGGLTDEQIIARRQQLATNYRVTTFFGLSYTFGSIYNTVVNPRFSQPGGGGRFLFFRF